MSEIREAAPPLPKRDSNPASNWVEKSGGLPAYIDRIARHLHAERGMDVGRAIATAVSIVRKVCATGKPHAGAKGEWNAKSHAEACAAAAEWEKKKAQSHAQEAWTAVERTPISKGLSPAACMAVLEAVDAGLSDPLKGFVGYEPALEALRAHFRDPSVIASLIEHGVTAVRLDSGVSLVEAAVLGRGGVAVASGPRGRGGGALKVWDESWVIRNRIGQFKEWIRKIPVGGMGSIGKHGAIVRKEHDGSVSVIGADGKVFRGGLNRIEDIADAADAAKTAAAAKAGRAAKKGAAAPNAKQFSVGVRLHTKASDPVHRGQPVSMFIDVDAASADEAAKKATRALTSGPSGEAIRRFVDPGRGVQVLHVQSKKDTLAGQDAPDLPQDGLFDVLPNGTSVTIDVYGQQRVAAQAKVDALSSGERRALADKIKAHNGGDSNATTWLVDNGFAKRRSGDDAAYARSRGERGPGADAYDTQRALERALGREEILAMSPEQRAEAQMLAHKAAFAGGRPKDSDAARERLAQMAPFAVTMQHQDRVAAFDEADRMADSAAASPTKTVVAPDREAFTGQSLPGTPDMDSQDAKAWAEHYDRMLADMPSAERARAADRLKVGGYAGEGTLVPYGPASGTARRELERALDRRMAGKPALLGDLKVGDLFYIRREDGQPNTQSGWMVVKGIERDPSGMDTYSVQASTGKMRKVQAGPKMRVFKGDAPEQVGQHNMDRASAAMSGANPGAQAIEDIRFPKPEMVKMAALAGGENVKAAARRKNAKYPETVAKIDAGEPMLWVTLGEHQTTVQAGVLAADGHWIEATNAAGWKIDWQHDRQTHANHDMDQIWADRRKALQRELGNVPIPVEVHTPGRSDIRRLDRDADWNPATAPTPQVRYSMLDGTPGPRSGGGWTKARGRDEYRMGDTTITRDGAEWVVSRNGREVVRRLTLADAKALGAERADPSPTEPVATPDASEVAPAPQSAGEFMEWWKQPETPGGRGNPFVSRYKSMLATLAQTDPDLIKQAAARANAGYDGAAEEIAAGTPVLSVSFSTDQRSGRTGHVVIAPSVLLADGGIARSADPVVGDWRSRDDRLSMLKHIEYLFRGQQVPVVFNQADAGMANRKWVMNPGERVAAPQA